MEYKKNHKIKLIKFGKKFFAFTIVLIIGISVLCLNNSNRNLSEKGIIENYKEETNNYLVEINYPKVNNKDLLAYVNEYLQNKEEEFKNDISDLENMNSSKYEFKTDYKISENEDVLGVHLIVYKYTGGPHYIRDDKWYYYNITILT